MLTKNQIQKFQKRLDEINKLQADVERMRCMWACELRACYSDGVEGDERFQSQLVESFGFKADAARRTLLYASAGKLTPDQFRAVGGWTGLHMLADKTSTERDEILSRALKEGVKVENLVKRDKPINNGPTKDDDLKAFASFVLKSRSASAEMKRRAELYVPRSKLKAVA